MFLEKNIDKILILRSLFNKMIKKLLKKAVPGLAGLALSLGGCAGDMKMKPFIGPSIDFQSVTQDYKIIKVPEKSRYVPIHPDDGYARESNNGPIPNDTVELPKLEEIRFLKGGIQTDIGDVRFDIYGDLSYRLEDTTESEWDNIHRRNYTNYPGTETRGVGAALTYYKAEYGDDIIPGIKAEVHLPVKDDFYLMLGAGYRKYNIDVIKGWDRWNALQRWKTEKLGEVEEKSIYFGIEILSGEKKNINLHLRGGANFNDIDAGEAEFKNNPTYFIGGGAAFRF